MFHVQNVCKFTMLYVNCMIVLFNRAKSSGVLLVEQTTFHLRTIPIMGKRNSHTVWGKVSGDNLLQRF